MFPRGLEEAASGRADESRRRAPREIPLREAAQYCFAARSGLRYSAKSFPKEAPCIYVNLAV